ncbi:hypothetical protein EGR_05716 [Echinococcus granulosus]|uniref:Uncharacterized protein n=1 Tax=Echinococcus granulosus TaxID=6210 RepID=W6UDQ2_ECHGR|nr:hypothetical protein EGR_05716 [Echinococcus granulosus]EUB59465.1 hypothetical protein EGR_05716 [Echinococcus granulosus]
METTTLQSTQSSIHLQELQTAITGYNCVHPLHHPRSAIVSSSFLPPTYTMAVKAGAMNAGNESETSVVSFVAFLPSTCLAFISHSIASYLLFTDSNQSPLATPSILSSNGVQWMESCSNKPFTIFCNEALRVDNFQTTFVFRPHLNAFSELQKLDYGSSQSAGYRSGFSPSEALTNHGQVNLNVL